MAGEKLRGLVDGRRGAARAALLLALLVLLGTFAPLADPAPRPGEALLATRPVALDPGRRSLRRAGPLFYLGGWSLGSADSRFGGLSALHVGERDILAVSDKGMAFRFARPDVPGSGRLAIAPLPRLPAGPRGGREGDAEAMVVQGETAWVAFESRNEVRRFALPGWRLESRAAPPAMRRWPGNSGAEAMVRLKDGRFLVLAEGRGRETSPALLFAGDPSIPGTAATRLEFRPPRRHRVTDAALLPDGRILVLSRRVGALGALSAALSLVDPAALVPGAPIDGREIVRLAAPLTIDNMEGLSVTSEGGRTIVWIVSDDNFSPLQRTLLLKFALEL